MDVMMIPAINLLRNEAHDGFKKNQFSININELWPSKETKQTSHAQNQIEFYSNVSTATTEHITCILHNAI